MNARYGDRASEIDRIIELASSARERAIEADLNFEAYLLELALKALEEQRDLEARQR